MKNITNTYVIWCRNCRRYYLTNKRKTNQIDLLGNTPYFEFTNTEVILNLEICSDCKNEMCV
jgi:hypothetical protein